MIWWIIFKIIIDCFGFGNIKYQVWIESLSHDLKSLKLHLVFPKFVKNLSFSYKSFEYPFYLIIRLKNYSLSYNYVKVFWNIP